MEGVQAYRISYRETHLVRLASDAKGVYLWGMATTIPSWTVTLRTGENCWSTITVEAVDHVEAGRIARRLIGAPKAPITEVV